MPAFSPNDQLVAIGDYLTPAEADILAANLNELGIAAKVDGGELTTLLSYVGTAIGGARVIVPKQHAEEAATLLHKLKSETERSDFPDGFDFGDDVPEGLDEEPSAELEGREDLRPKEYDRILQRAFNGAIVGLFLAPFFVSAYSMWLIFRYALWSRDDIGVWRLYAALPCNLFSFWLGKFYWFG